MYDYNIESSYIAIVISNIVREQDELPCAFHGESKQLI